MIQNITTYIIGVIALVYVIKVILVQFTRLDINIKCENCPIPKMKRSLND